LLEPREFRVGWDLQLLTLFFCHPACSARLALLHPNFPDVADRLTSLMTNECTEWLEYVTQLDRKHTPLISNSQLNKLVDGNDAMLILGDAIDAAKYRIPGVRQHELNLFKRHGGTLLGSVHDKFLTQQLSGKVESIDLLYAILNNETPHMWLDPTHILTNLAKNQSYEYYQFVGRQSGTEISEVPAYLLEIRFDGKRYHANLMSNYGAYSQFSIAEKPKPAPTQLFIASQPPIFWAKDIHEFEELINQHDQAAESRLQKFFEERSRFLRALGFVSFRPQVHLIQQEIDGNGNKKANLVPDFLAEKAGLGSKVIIELKRASTRMTSGPLKRRQLSANLYRALRQLEDYYDFFSDRGRRDWFRDTYGEDISNPELVLIMGNEDLSVRPLQRIISTPTLNRPVHVLSYGDVLRFVRMQHLVLPDTFESG